ncbi:hypothetical protein GCM10023213_01310 [Prosthecobacter algae]|uniref:Secreted protein with PEP-CTERM sorting signal n=1 Tax=Prosthecobacter algae TaxID=1144682 RepID=A0ABP9NUV3_9BACT
MKLTALKVVHGCALRVTRDCRLLAALSSLLLASPLPAQTLQWDANGTGDGVTDGGGTWNTSNSNWWNGSTNVSWNNAAGSIAVLGNGTSPGLSTAAATITLNGTLNAGGLQFNTLNLTNAETRAYVLTGGTLALTNEATISLANGSSNVGNARITISSAISGNNIKLEKTGTDLGLITLNGANTWTGTLTMPTLANSGGVFLSVGNIASISSLGAIDVQTNNSLVINYGQTNAMNVAISLAGTGNGARGALRFDQNRTLSGPITLTAGAGISTNAGATTGNIAGNIGELGGSRALTINSSTAAAGTIVLSGNNTFTGGVIVNNGTLRIGSVGALNSSSPNLLTFANSTQAKSVVLDGFSITTAGLSTKGSTDVVTVQNANATPATLTLRNATTQTFRGSLSDGTGGGALSLVKTGLGTQVLTRANTYTGSTTITAGSLQLDFAATGAPASNILGSSSTLVLNGGTLALTGGASAANSQTVNGLTVAPGRSTISLTTNATTPQNLLLNVGAITVQNGGTVNFILPAGTQGVSNGIRTTSINDASGILGGWATVNGNDWASVSGGNIVAYTGYQQITNFSSGDNSQGPLPNNPNANVKIVDGGTAGDIALGNPSGITDINTLVQASVGPAVIASGSTATLRLGTQGGILLTTDAGNLTVGAAPNNGSVLTAGGSVSGTAGQISFTDQVAAQVTTVNSIINDNGAGVTVAVVKNGPGTLILAGTTSSYTGGTFLNGGLTRIAADRSLGAIPGSAQAGNLTFNGGTLQWATGFNLSSNRGIALLAGGGAFDTQIHTTTYGGIISGPGGLTKLATGSVNGSGTLALTGANTYAGETVVTSGTLLISHNQALGSTAGGTQVASAGILRLNEGITVTGETLTLNGPGNNQGNLQVQTGSAEWAGDIIIGNDAARIGTGTATGVLTISGVIKNGAGSKLGISAQSGGTVILSGANTYTGVTEMIRGTLRLGQDNALASATVLSLLTNTVVTEAVAVDLYGFDQTVSGLRHGVVSNVDNINITNSQAGDESIFTLNQATNQTYSGKITGNLAFIKEGAGTLTLTNTFNAIVTASPLVTTPVASVSNYTGKTTIRAGTLALSENGNLTGTPWIQVDQNALFSISGRSSGDYTLNAQVLSGRGSVNGLLNVAGSSYLSPGDSTGSLANAGNGLGELTFTNLTLQGGTPTLRALFQIGATSSNLADILSAGNPAYFANADSGGLYDSLQVNGTLGLNAGSTLKVELQGSYVPQLGDVFNLLDWTTTLNPDADGAGGAGAFTLADLDLTSANAILMNNGWFFETSQFLEHGIIYVAVIPEPSRALLLTLGGLFLLGRRHRSITQGL